MSLVSPEDKVYSVLSMYGVASVGPEQGMVPLTLAVLV